MRTFPVAIARERLKILQINFICWTHDHGPKKGEWVWTGVETIEIHLSAEKNIMDAGAHSRCLVSRSGTQIWCNWGKEQFHYWSSVTFSPDRGRHKTSEASQARRGKTKAQMCWEAFTSLIRNNVVTDRLDSGQSRRVWKRDQTGTLLNRLENSLMEFEFQQHHDMKISDRK